MSDNKNVRRSRSHELTTSSCVDVDSVSRPAVALSSFYSTFAKKIPPLLAAIMAIWTVYALSPKTREGYHEIGAGIISIPPKHATGKAAMTTAVEANMTLRDFLTDPVGFHLAMAPAFFGFYGYFGVLAAWEELNIATAKGDSSVGTTTALERIRSVAGASAGAMAAILFAAGVSPAKAADYCSTITLDKFNDWPGVGAVFRGNAFERLMRDFLETETAKTNTTTGRIAAQSCQMQDGVVPVAVSAFDLQTMEGKILRTGSMARAARASATFPFLFQPVGWKGVGNDNQTRVDYMLVDGGITDVAGIKGLLDAVAASAKKNSHDNSPSSSSTSPAASTRVINLCTGDFLGGTPPGPSSVPGSSELLSISLRNMPSCGPWAMENGPRAVKAARRAMEEALDLPLYHGREASHYELHLDTSKFWREKD